MEDNFFEGAEKLLEVWFGREPPPNMTSSSGSDEEEENIRPKNPDLRDIPRTALESILKMVKCEILSFKRNDSVDAYVLSESSMFVSRDRFLIKTCGSTALLRCLEPIIFLAREVAGFDEVLDVFYSRKNFIRPELQDNPHSDFSLETQVLDSYFDEGAAYCLGRLNQDHWFFYTLAPLLPGKGVSGPDQTLEVLMQNLNPEEMAIFSKAVCSTAKEATEKAGIDKLIPGAVIDDFLFGPCGYSMNGLIRGGYYMTIHVTPESDFSYVSFETNFPNTNYADLVSRVVKTFDPSNFMVTLMANETSAASKLKAKDLVSALTGGSPSSSGDGASEVFKLKELQTTQVKKYEVTFRSFAKAPS